MSCYSMLLEAVKSEDLSFLESFIEERHEEIDFNDADEDGITCLHIAAGLDNVDILKCLIKNGASIHSRTNDELTPLHIAGMWGKERQVEVLLHHGANPSILDSLNYTEVLNYTEEDLVEDEDTFLYETAIEEKEDQRMPCKSQTESLDSVITLIKSLKIEENNWECPSDLLTEVSLVGHMESPNKTYDVGEEKIPHQELDSAVFPSPTTKRSVQLFIPNNKEEKEQDHGSKLAPTWPSNPFKTPRGESSEGTNTNSMIEKSANEGNYTDETISYQWKETTIDQRNETMAIIPNTYKTISCMELRRRIKEHGHVSGPITQHTRLLYVKKLWKLDQGIGKRDKKVTSPCISYPFQTRMVMEGRCEIPNCIQQEQDMVNEFSMPTKKTQWRGGNEKSSFNYLLLDPRVTLDLPLRSKKLSTVEAFRCFILSIFYVGKGKRSRPYAHLHEALKYTKSKLDLTSKRIGMKLTVDVLLYHVHDFQ
ncbi:uncharacterized protein LOC124452497 isoform X2 [Xenia sp. Carnegie-2017]|uniref:uncharacterized protein LOC124452497 isoform X2 n=1 Tax=Xenia sp. Carnegie-2017 TaxID=2897299 RepID=UPI001F048B69|nr:uncharacterized protein LOC124452497 isoform X2 [Xenia sp. Carnegie-2017]